MWDAHAFAQASREKLSHGRVGQANQRHFLLRVLLVTGWYPILLKQWPDIGALGTASLANELRFKIGQPNVIGPLLAADFHRIAAVIVRAIDQQPADAGRSHFPEGYFRSRICVQRV